MITRQEALKLREMIEKSSASLSDGDALDAVWLFKAWKPDTWYEVDDKRWRYDGKLYRVRQAHTSQAQYPPGIETAALYEEVHKPGQGDDPSNPIPYNNNMELIKDKYYSQNNIVYICTRSTGIAVYNNLADLVGIYVEVV